MTEEQRNCDHGMWDDVGDWRKEIEYVSGTLRYPVQCAYCGLVAEEVYTFACRVTEAKRWQDATEERRRTMTEYVVTYYRQETADNGDKYLAAFPSHATVQKQDGTPFTKEEAIQYAREHPREVVAEDDEEITGIYFAGVMRASDFSKM